MIKRLSVILAAALLFSLTACANQPADTSGPDDQAASTETSAPEISAPCTQDGCDQIAVDSYLPYCQNHAGICGLCKCYIEPGKEYCNQCAYDMGLPVDDPDFVPEGSGFTNRYGTPSTICAHSGCSKTIASSGDTNCCKTHSNRCGNCGCYIDEDAMFCMDCLEDALGS